MKQQLSDGGRERVLSAEGKQFVAEFSGGSRRIRELPLFGLHNDHRHLTVTITGAVSDQEIGRAHV